MRTIPKSACAGLAAAALLAFAAPAGADVRTAAEKVKAHTSKADRGLERAIGLFERNADGKGRRAFAESRAEMGLAKADAAKAGRKADGRSERADAAKANRALAEQQDENIEELVDLLDEVGGRVEKAVAKAALADTRGRDKALGVIGALLAEGTPEAAEKGLTRALQELAKDRDDEVAAAAEALAEGEVSGRSAEKVAKAIEETIAGQARAAEQLAGLIESSDMPEQSKQGLQRAYDAIIKEQEASADVLEGFSDRMPERVRSFVTEIIEQARENARELRDNRPSPPGGQPSEPPADGGPFS